MRLGAMVIMGHAQFRRVGLPLIGRDMISSSAVVLAGLGDILGCFFALFDVRQALVGLFNAEIDEKDIKLCLVPFDPRRGTPPSDDDDGDADAIPVLCVPRRRAPPSIEDVDVIEAKLYASFRRTPPSKPSTLCDDGLDARSCLDLFV